MDRDGMVIATGTDGPFARHLAVMLLSLADTAKDLITVYVLWSGDTQERDALIEAVRLTPLRVHIVDVPDLGNLMVNGHVTKAAYNRLIMGDLLPPDLDRVLYLDGDMLVRGDLSDLWETDIGDKTIGAVTDLPTYSSHAELGLPIGAPYFNSGMMLIDLKRWRDQKVGERALAFIREHPERLRWWDQCALNLTLCGDWISLPETWNYQTLHCGRYVHGGLVRFDRVNRRDLTAAKIVHFNSPSKPWHFLNDHPFKREYWSLRLRTPWGIERYQDFYPHNIARRALCRYFPSALPAYARLRATA